MLFNASTVYAPGEPHGDVSGSSGYQNVNLLGRYHLDEILRPNVWVALIALALVAYIVHRHGRGRK
jgi:hypothetical protein